MELHSNNGKLTHLKEGLIQLLHNGNMKYIVPKETFYLIFGNRASSVHSRHYPPLDKVTLIDMRRYCKALITVPLTKSLFFKVKFRAKMDSR